MNTDILSIDVETNGLYGEVLAIGAVVYSKSDKNEFVLKKQFCNRLSDLPKPSDKWVQDNLYPTISKISNTQANKIDLLSEFYNFYQENKPNSKIICHMGYICEAKLLRELVENSVMDEFDGPFPLFDISILLDFVVESSVSVDEYYQKNFLRLEKNDFGGEHNPLQDADDAAQVFIDVVKNYVGLQVNPHEKKRLFSNLFCSHKFIKKIRNVHGDEVWLTRGKREIYQCQICNKSLNY